MRTTCINTKNLCTVSTHFTNVFLKISTINIDYCPKHPVFKTVNVSARFEVLIEVLLKI
jgi:hypothetical protein